MMKKRPIQDSDIFAELAKKLHFKAKFVASSDSLSSNPSSKIAELIPQPDNLQCINHEVLSSLFWGHIDHGKTTLLDYLRKSSSLSLLLLQNTITFIDTPGHAAFKSMRNRGVCATDIAILVVDACEGVLEQTLESLNKPNADVNATKESLKELGKVNLEDFGGDVQSISMSALKGTNVDGFLNAIGALAEVLELKGDPTGQVRGVILESQMEAGIGRSTVFLVQKGTLKKGDILVAETHYAKIRTIKNEFGKSLNNAGPSQVVRISGWKSLPSAGDEVLQSSSEKKALDVVKTRNQVKMTEKALMETMDIEKKTID
ncbi:infB [Lepeophtheirus salmonis]|uniref:InfB n=1 Tax=Lepeophtheirus salmonis TaxID=72036 RepID=A0A7R8CPC2_LEPSM|nr:infB [Lepeophtheirus salmonis]CAF2884859.1 infB [Lepeophtheirus salmonis]